MTPCALRKSQKSLIRKNKGSRDVKCTNAIAFAYSAVLALCLGFAGANASEPAAKSRDKPEARPAAPTIDKKVADSRTIFIGEGVRIYFVDRKLREVPYIRAAGAGANRTAMVVVKVVKVLHGADSPGQVLVPIETNRDAFGIGRSPYDGQVERHVGKQGIWFGDLAVHGDPGDERAPMTVLQSRTGEARAPAANPLPVKFLKEVTESIARVRAGGEKAAALKAEP